MDIELTCGVWMLLYFRLSLQSFVGAAVGFMPIRNCCVSIRIHYHHSDIRPRLGNYDFKQLLDTELFCKRDHANIGGSDTRINYDMVATGVRALRLPKGLTRVFFSFSRLASLWEADDKCGSTAHFGVVP